MSMTPIERATKAVEDALIGHVDPTSHAMSEYGIAKMIVPIVLTALREPSEGMVREGVLSTVEVWDDDRDAERELTTEWQAMIDAALAEG